MKILEKVFLVVIPVLIVILMIDIDHSLRHPFPTENHIIFIDR